RASKQEQCLGDRGDSCSCAKGKAENLLSHQHLRTCRPEWRRPLRQAGAFAFCRNDSLGPSILTVLFQQTIRPSYCVSNPGTFGLSSFHPIFFRWRKRQPKQISRTGDYASSHVHPKHGATRKAWRLKSRIWQPSLNSRADSLRCGVLLDITLDL